jgi:hypothetical protein
MSDDVDRVIVGWRGERSKALPGSVRNACSECSGEVWLAPSGQRLKAAGARVLCIECALALMEPDTRIELAPGAADEFTAAMRAVT